MMKIVQMTPGWVFGLLLLLVVLGCLQSRTRAMSLLRVTLLPLAMTALSVYSVWSAFGPRVTGLLAWSLGFAIAVLANAGWLHLPRGVRYDAASRRYLVPGSWTPLALMMVIFVAKYAVNATLAMVPAAAAAPLFVGAASAVFGVSSGVFFARALHILRSARPSPKPAALVQV